MNSITKPIDTGRSHRRGRRLSMPLFVLLAAIAFMLCVSLGGNTDYGSAYGHGEDYYFPWYDSLYGQTWIIMAEPSTGSGNAFDAFFKPQGQPLMVQMNESGPIAVSPGGQPGIIIKPGSMGGPVNVQSLHQGLVSERSLFGNSFEEVWASMPADLDSHYWWPWYDNYTSGMQNWIMVSNPPDNPYAVRARVIIHIPQEYGGNIVLDSPGPIQPGGDAWTPQFPGVAGGPVEVVAWRDGTACCQTRENVVSSQRILYNGAFNEMPGIPAKQLDDTYFWTWYDNQTPGSENLIVLANPNNQTVYVTAGIGLVEGGGGPDPDDFLPLGPYETTFLQAPGVMDGPVIAFGCYNPADYENTLAPLVATQQILWGPSYGEIAGIPESEIFSTNANWTWYDQQSPGSLNWVLISNLNDFQVYYEVTIAGALQDSGYINKLDRITPAFPGVMGGPVEVKAWTDSGKSTPAPIFASQRVLWNGYFNEIVGKGV